MESIPPQDEVNAAGDGPAPGPPTVGQLMSPAPDGVGEFMSVVAVARRMRALGIVSVPICADDKRFLGMVSHRDIVEQCVADGQRPSAVAAGSLLGDPQPTVSPGRIADRTVLALILSQQLGEIPVVEDGRLVGLISVADMAAQLFDDTDLLDDTDEFWLPDSANGT
jgi:CBS domain-containing protein